MNSKRERRRIVQEWYREFYSGTKEGKVNAKVMQYLYERQRHAYFTEQFIVVDGRFIPPADDIKELINIALDNWEEEWFYDLTDRLKVAERFKKRMGWS